MDKKIRYFVEGKKMLLHLEGDREEDGSVWGEGDHLGDFATAEEAEEAARAYLEEKSNVVNPTRRGIGSVTHWAVEVERCVEDEDFGWIACSEDGSTEDEFGFIPNDAWLLALDTLDGSPERAAFTRARTSYFEWLDYHDDGYDTVSDVMVLMRAQDSSMPTVRAEAAKRSAGMSASELAGAGDKGRGL